MQYEYHLVKDALKENESLSALAESSPKTKRLVSNVLAKINENIVQTLEKEYTKAKNIALLEVELQDALGLEIVSDEEERFAVVVAYNEKYETSFSQIQLVLKAVVHQWAVSVSNVGNESSIVYTSLEEDCTVEYVDIVEKYTQSLKDFVIDHINDVF